MFLVFVLLTKYLALCSPLSQKTSSLEQERKSQPPTHVQSKEKTRPLPNLPLDLNVVCAVRALCKDLQEQSVFNNDFLSILGRCRVWVRVEYTNW